jgi:hypothetical protein
MGDLLKIKKDLEEAWSSLKEDDRPHILEECGGTYEWSPEQRGKFKNRVLRRLEPCGFNVS